MPQPIVYKDYSQDGCTVDIGCGGNVKNPFRCKFGYGIDLNSVSENPAIIQSDFVLSPLPFQSSSLAAITAFDVIEHIPRIIYTPERKFPFINLMSEIYRCLRKGGVFLSYTPAFPHPEAFQDPTHVNIITEQTFPMYFCAENNNSPLAAMYGFSGSFTLLSQDWDQVQVCKLRTILRKDSD